MQFDSRFDSLKGSALSPSRDLAKRIKSRTDVEVLLFLKDHSDGWFEDIEIHSHTQSSRREVFASLYALADSGLGQTNEQRNSGVLRSISITSLQ